MKDSAASKEEKQDLEDLRRPFADSFWEQAQIPPVEDAEEWDVDGPYWSRRVFWEDSPQSRVGSFGIEFEPDMVKIRDHWVQ